MQKPIVFTQEEIEHDMFEYADKFNKDIIPHLRGSHNKETDQYEITEIVDKIHNYQRHTKPPNYDT